MPRLFWSSVIIVPLAVIVSLVVASKYQLPLRFEDVSSGKVAPNGHMDRSIPSLFSMADIHGDYPKALAALIHAGVVDENGDWAAGNSTFVSCGKHLIYLRSELIYFRSKLGMWSTEVLIHKSCIDG